MKKLLVAVIFWIPTALLAQSGQPCTTDSPGYYCQNTYSVCAVSEGCPAGELCTQQYQCYDTYYGLDCGSQTYSYCWPGGAAANTVRKPTKQAARKQKPQKNYSPVTGS